MFALSGRVRCSAVAGFAGRNLTGSRRERPFYDPRVDDYGGGYMHDDGSEIDTDGDVDDIGEDVDDDN